MKRCLLVGLLLSFACADNSPPDDRNDGFFGPFGGGVVSLDGRLEVLLPPGAISQEVQVAIVTRDTAPGLLSKTYRLEPDLGDLAEPATVLYHLDPDQAAAAPVLVRLDGSRPEALEDNQIFSEALFVRGVIRDLRAPELALAREAEKNCVNAACGVGCEVDGVPRFCNGQGGCAADLSPLCEPAPDGEDVQAGEGEVAFVVRGLSLGEAGDGLDVNGRCLPGDCRDNAVSPFRSLYDDFLRAHLFGEASLFVLELSGLDLPYAGHDERLTLSLLSVVDADEPSFPANNFQPPPGHDSCCEFRVRSSSFDPVTFRARDRLPVRIERGHLLSVAPADLAPALEDLRISPMRLLRARVSARVSADLSQLYDGVLGAVIPAADLAGVCNPYCGTSRTNCRGSAPPTLWEQVAVGARAVADVDLDGDGSECFFDTDGDQAFDLCCDGAGFGQPCATPSGHCFGRVVPPVDPLRPYTCVLDPDIADGFSVAFRFDAVRASLLGVRPPPVWPARSTSRVAVIDVARIEDHYGDLPRSTTEAGVLAADVRLSPGWDLQLDLPGPARRELEEDGCSLDVLAQPEPFGGLDLGHIRIEDHPGFPGALLEPIDATFTGGHRWHVDPAAPTLSGSTGAVDRRISISGEGHEENTRGAWPVESGFGLRAPPPLRLAPLQAIAFRERLSLQRGELLLAWIPEPPRSDQQLVIRVIVPQAELRCVLPEPEDGQFTVPRRILDALRDLLGFERTEGVLQIERVSTQRLPVSAELETEVVARVRQVVRGRVQL